MKNLIILFLTVLTISVSAQSPFKSLPKPSIKHKGIAFGSPEITAFRFSAPAAGTAFYSDGEIKVVTGIGYGLQRLHFDQTSQKYYADFSFKATAFASGNVTPSFKDNNILGVGAMVGVLNELLNAGFIYNIPTSATKGKIGIIFSIGIPLNN